MASRDPLAGFNKYRSLTRGSNFARRFQPYRGSAEWSSNDPNQQGDPYWTGRLYSGRSQAEGAYIGRRQEDVRADALRAIDRYGHFLEAGDIEELQQIAETGQFKPRGEGKFINTLQTVDWLGAIVRSGVADLLNASRQEFSWWDAIKASAPWANEAQRDKIPRDLWAKGEMFGFTGSQIMRNLGWDETDLGNKILRGTAGFVFDVATDPLTYATWGLAAVGKKGALTAWRSTMRTATKDAIERTVAKEAATTKGGVTIQKWIERDLKTNLERLKPEIERLAKGDPEVVRQLTEEAREVLLRLTDDWSAIEATDDLAIKLMEEGADQSVKSMGEKVKDILAERLPFLKRGEGIEAVVRDAWQTPGRLQNTIRDKQNELYRILGDKQFKTLRTGEFRDFVELLPGDKAWAAGGVRLALPWGRAKHSSIYVGFATDRAVTKPFRDGMEYLGKYVHPGLTSRSRSMVNSIKSRLSKDWPTLEAARKGAAWDAHFAEGLQLRIASTIQSIENPRVVQATVTALEEAIPEGIDRTIVRDMLWKAMDQGVEAIEGYAPKGFPPELVARVQEEAANIKDIYDVVFDAIRTVNPDIGGLENFSPMIKSQWYHDLMRGLAQQGQVIDDAMLDAAPDLDTRIGLEYLGLEQRAAERQGALSLTKMDENGHLRPRPNLAFHGEHQVGDDIVRVWKPDEYLRSGETVNVSRTQLNKRISLALNFLQEQRPDLFDKFPKIGPLGKGKKNFLDAQAFDMDFPKVYDAYLQTLTKWFSYEAAVRAGKVLGAITPSKRALNIQATLNRVLDGEASLHAERMTPYLENIARGLDELMGNRRVKTEVAGEMIGYVKRMVLENPKVKVALLQIERFLKENEGRIVQIHAAMEQAVSDLVQEGMPESMARQFVAAADGPVEGLRRAVNAAVDDAARQTDEIMHAVLADIGSEVSEVGTRQVLHESLTEATRAAKEAIANAVGQYSSTVKFSFNAESQYVDLVAKNAGGKSAADGLAHVLTREAKKIVRDVVEKHNPGALPDLDRALRKDEFTLEGLTEAMQIVRDGAEAVYQKRAKEAWLYLVDEVTLSGLTWEEASRHMGPLYTWKVLQDIYGFADPEVIDNALYNVASELAEDMGLTYAPRQAAGYKTALGETQRVADEYDRLMDVSTTLDANGLDLDDFPAKLVLVGQAHEELRLQTMAQVRRLTELGYRFEYLDNVTWEMRQQALANKVILMPRPHPNQSIAPIWGDVDEATGMRYIDLFDGVFGALGVGPFGADALDERAVTNGWINHRQLFKDVELGGSTIPVRDAHGTLTRGRYLAGQPDQPAGIKLALMGDDFTDPQPIPKGVKQSVRGTLGSEGRSGDVAAKTPLTDFGELPDTATAGVDAFLKATKAQRSKLGVDVAFPDDVADSSAYGVRPKRTKSGEVMTTDVADWWFSTYEKLLRKVARGDMTQEQADRYFIALTTTGDHELALEFARAYPGPPISEFKTTSLVDEPAVGGEKLYGLSGAYPTNQAAHDDLFEWLELEGRAFRKSQVTRKEAEKIRKGQKEAARARFSNRYTGGFTAAGETKARTPAQDVLTDASDERLQLQAALAVDIMGSREAEEIRKVVRELNQIQHDLDNILRESEPGRRARDPRLAGGPVEEISEDELVLRWIDSAKAVEERLNSLGRRTLRGERAKPYTVTGSYNHPVVVGVDPDTGEDLIEYQLRRTVLGSGGSKQEAWEEAMGKLERHPSREGGYWFRGRTDTDMNLVWENEAPPIEIDDIEFDFNPRTLPGEDIELLDMPAGREGPESRAATVSDEVDEVPIPTGTYQTDPRGRFLQLSDALQRQVVNKQKELEARASRLLDLMPEESVGETLANHGLNHGFEGLDFTHPRLATPHWESLWDAAFEKSRSLEIDMRQTEVRNALDDPELMWNGNVYRGTPKGGFAKGGLADDPERAKKYMGSKQETPFEKGGLIGVRKQDIPEEVLRQTGKDPKFPKDVEYYVVLNDKERVLYENFDQAVDKRIEATQMRMARLQELKDAGPPYSETYNTLKELERKLKAYGGTEEANIRRYAFEVERDELPDRVRNVVGRTYDEGGEWVIGNEPLRIATFITKAELAGDFTQSVAARPSARSFIANRSAEAVRDTAVLGDNHFGTLTKNKPGGVLAGLRSGDTEMIAQSETELRWWLDRIGLESERLVIDTVHGRPRVRWLSGDPIEMGLDEIRDLARGVLPDADGMTATEILMELGSRYGGGFDDLPSGIPLKLQSWLTANADGLDDLTTEVDALRTQLAKLEAEAASIGATREIPQGARDFLMRYDDWLDAVDGFKMGRTDGKELEMWFQLLRSTAADYLSEDELARLVKVHDLIQGQKVFGAVKARALSGITDNREYRTVVRDLVEKLRTTVDEVADSSGIPKWEAQKMDEWQSTVDRFLQAVFDLRKFHQPPGSAVAETPVPVNLIGESDRAAFEGAMQRLRDAIDGFDEIEPDGTIVEIPGLRQVLGQLSGDHPSATRLRRWLADILPPGIDMDNLDDTTKRWFNDKGEFQSKKFLYDARQYLNASKVEPIEDSIAIGKQGLVDPALYGIGGDALTDMLVEPWMGVMLENMAYQIRAAYTPYGLTVAGEYTRKVHTYWKMASTVLRPSFSPRNFVGGAFNAMAFGVGVNDFRWVGTRMMRLKAAERHGTRWQLWAAKNLSKADNEVLHAAMQHGVVGTSFSSTISKQAARGKPHLMAVNAGAIAMETVEDYLRLATFRKFYKVGQPETANFAAQMALVSQFDYKNLTKIEQSIVRYVPFFVWTRNNIPLQFRMLMEKPGYANRYQHLMSNVNASFDDTPDETTWLEQQAMPTWMSGLTADLGVTMGREGLWARLLLSPDVPLRDLEQLAIMSDQGAVGYAQWVGEMVSPLITLPVSFIHSGFNDEGWVNAPAGLSWAFRAIPFVNKRPVEGEGIQISQRARDTLETAIPFAREWTELVGIDPNEARRGARLGYDYESGTSAGQRARAAALTLGKGFGFKTTTPADSIYTTGEGERRIQEIIQAAMLKGIIPDDYRYPGQRR